MKKILIVDDESWIRHGIREQIDCEAHGVEIIGEAGNGRQAIEIIERESPEIILTDVRMPVMDGIELIEHLHRNKIGAKTVIISGYSEFDYAKKAIDYDVFSYLLKPIDDEELNSTIRQIALKLDEEKQIGGNEYEYPNSRIKNFIYCIENLYGEEVFDEIDYLFREIEPIALRNTILSIVLALNNLLQNYNSTVEKVIEEHDIAKTIVNETVNTEELKSRLIGMVTSIMEYLEANKKTAVKRIINEAVEYILSNYSEDISLQVLSDRYFLNMTYLSRMFKTEVGMNFNEFLNKTRMEAAGELLKKDNLKAKDIAKLTGYSSSDYFFKKFKSYYKMTPSQYRKNNR